MYTIFIPICKGSELPRERIRIQTRNWRGFSAHPSIGAGNGQFGKNYAHNDYIII